MPKKIKVELSEIELRNILNSIQVRALSDNIDEEEKILGNKITKALIELERKK